ncbi:hypothetical protein D3C87_2040160 [compost metagenome]
MFHHRIETDICAFGHRQMRQIAGIFGKGINDCRVDFRPENKSAIGKAIRQKKREGNLVLFHQPVAEQLDSEVNGVDMRQYIGPA